MSAKKRSLRHVAVLAVLAGWLCACPGQGDRVRWLGSVLPLTGSAAEIGDSVRKGIELGLLEKNLEILPSGRQYRIRYEDSRALPREGSQAVRRLIESEIPAIIGPAASGVVLESARLANQSMTVIISPTASNPTIHQAGPYVFRTTSSDVAEAQAMANYCRKANLRHIGLITIQNAFGDGFREAFRERFERLGGRLVADERFAQGSTEFEGHLRRIQERSPDAIYLVGYPAEMIRFLHAKQALNIQLPVLSTGNFRFQPILQRAAEAAEGVVFTQPAYDPGDEDPTVRRFVESFRKRYGREPDIFAAHAYDTVRLLISVVEIAGYEGEEIRSSLFAVEEFPGVTGPITFDQQGDVVKIPRLWTVHQSRFVPLR